MFSPNELISHIENKFSNWIVNRREKQQKQNDPEQNLFLNFQGGDLNPNNLIINQQQQCLPEINYQHRTTQKCKVNQIADNNNENTQINQINQFTSMNRQSQKQSNILTILRQIKQNLVEYSYPLITNVKDFYNRYVVKNVQITSQKIKQVVVNYEQYQKIQQNQIIDINNNTKQNINYLQQQHQFKYDQHQDELKQLIKNKRQNQQEQDNCLQIDKQHIIQI